MDKVTVVKVRSLFLVILVMLFFINTHILSLATEEEKVRHARILLISSYDYGWESVPKQLQGFTDVMNGYAKVDYFFMKTKTIPYETAKIDTYNRIAWNMQNGVNYDLVVLGDDAALDFALEYQDILFEGLPMVFEGINTEAKAERAAQDPLITGVVESFPMEDTIALAKEIYPNATTIVGIVDDSESARGSLEQYYDSKPYFPELIFETLDCSHMTEQEIMQKVASYDTDTILLYLLVEHTADRGDLSVLEAVELITSTANVPVFKPDEIGVGAGLLGGVVIFFEDMGRQAGEMALAILNGTAPSEIPVTTIPYYAVVDENIMKKFAIKPSSIPHYVKMINHQLSFWEKYHSVLTPAGGVIAFLTTILVLIIIGNERKKRYFVQLREKDLMLDSLVKNIPGGIAIYKFEDGLKTLYSSEGVPKMSGRTKQEYLDLIHFGAYEEAIYEEDLDKVRHTIFAAVEKKEKFVVTYRLKHIDGSLVWVQLSAMPIRVENNYPVYYAVYTTMANESVLYRDINAESPSGIFICSCEDYTMLYANKRILQDKESTEYLGKRCYEFLLHRDRPCEDCPMHQMSKDEFMYREYDLGDRHLILKSKIFDFHGVRANIEYVTDDTERYKEQAKKLEKALQEAEDANAAKTEFLSRMSHDMRTPMNGILGATYIMERQNEISEIKKEIVHLRESGNYLLQLINDVLDVNKIESRKFVLHLKSYELEKVCDTIIEMMLPQIHEKSIVFHVEKKNIDGVCVMMDAQRVKEILMNILSNAIKFTPNGGNIDFIIEARSQENERISCQFVVRDTGIGMEETFIPNIFEPFVQENRIEESLSGTGLGLPIVKSLVELMGGTIAVKSKVNRGTEFKVSLQFALEKQRQQQELVEKQAEKTVLPNHLKILLCEDHALNAKIVIMLLENENTTVTWMKNGQLGVEAFQTSAIDTYDIVFMDIRMPVMDGIAAAKAIRALDRPDAKTVPIIAVTANAYEEDVRKSLEAGMNEHLAKPIEPAQMYEVIAKYVTK